MVGPGAAAVGRQCHAGRRRRRCVQREAEAGGRGHIAGHVGLANLNGVGAFDRGERAGPGLAVVDRVLNECAGLDAERVSAPLLVMWSVPELPLSVASATPGAVGPAVLSVKLKLAALDTLPATSVWRTATVLRPSTAVNELVQVWPLLIEY